MYDTESAQQTIIHAMQENMFAHMLFFPERLSSFSVVKAQGLTLVDSGMDDDTFNLVFNTRLKDHALDIVESTVDYFKRESLSFAWWVGPDDVPITLPELLAQVGLKLSEKNVGMYLPIAENAFEQGELRVERVLDATQMQDFAQIMIDVLGDTPAIKAYYQKLVDFPFSQDDYEQLYVGYLDETPVTCGMLTLHSKVAGIHSLATVRNQQNKGFGTAMVQELLMRAQMAEYAVAVLQAEKRAMHLYEQLGFDSICDFYVYTLDR
ncbi:MAG: GNAT family N-acetyltransferase [Candidatus Dependentiae bacterium]